MIYSSKKYDMRFIDYGVNAHIEINVIIWLETATFKKWKELFKLITAWQNFDLYDEIAADIKTALGDMKYYFGLEGNKKAALYKRLYKVLKYLESTFLIDIEDFKPDLNFL